MLATLRRFPPYRRVRRDGEGCRSHTTTAQRYCRVETYTEIPYTASTHTVIETPAFLASARDEELGEAERYSIVTYLATNPTAGDLIKGTGGARKVRFATAGKGKSGGYRVITYFGAEDIPVFRLDVYSKETRSDLSQSERNELRKLLADLPELWRARSKHSDEGQENHDEEAEVTCT